MQLDGEELTSRVHRRRKRQKKNILALCTLVLLVLIFIWYRFFYINTPAYAVKKIGEAISTHDLELFNRYVNLDVLLMTNYDDLIGNLISYDSELTEEDLFKAKKFYSLVKPQISIGFAKTIRHFVQRGTFEGELKDNILYGRQIGIDYEYLLLRSALKNTAFRELISIEKKADHAIATIKVEDTYSKTDFLLKLYLEQNKDDTFRLLHIDNYHTYLDTIAPIQKLDTRGYLMATETTVKEYNQKFELQKLRFQEILAGKDIDFKENDIMALENLTQEIISALNERQERLNSFDIGKGSTHISKLRRTSSALSIKFFECLLEAIKTNSIPKYQEAETIHKELLDTESLIEDISTYKALSLPPKEVR